MRWRVAAIAALAVLAAGCGSGGGSSASDAADLVPPTALGYITVDTNVSSGELSSAKSIVDTFPFGSMVLRELRTQIAQGGISTSGLESSIGPELDIAILRVDGRVGAVGFTRPRNEKTFDRQLTSGSSSEVHAKIDGWTAFADTKPFLDAVQTRSGRLATEPAYIAAFKTVPGAGDAIARAFVAPAGLRVGASSLLRSLSPSVRGALSSTTGAAGWISAALSSTGGAFKLELHAKSAASKASASSSLAGQLPSGSILAASFVEGSSSGNSSLPASAAAELGALSKEVGTNLAKLIPAINGPVIAYLRPGAPLAEVTLALKPADPQRVLAALGPLLQKAAGGQAKPVPTKVDGGTLEKLDLGSTSIYYGSFDGEVVVTDSENAIAELKGSVGRLAGDAIFKEAQSGAGLPEANQGFVFVNAKDALPALEGFAKLGKTTLPQSVAADLKPLRSLLFYGSRSGAVESLVLFLKAS